MLYSDEIMLVAHLESLHTEAKKIMDNMGINYTENSLLPFVSKDDLMEYIKDHNIELVNIFEIIGSGYKTICFLGTNEILHINPQPMTPKETMILYKCKKEDEYFRLQMELYKETGELL